MNTPYTEVQCSLRNVCTLVDGQLMEKCGEPSLNFITVSNDWLMKPGVMGMYLDKVLARKIRSLLRRKMVE